MTNTAAIATKLNVLESAIVRVEEWASVVFVVVKGLGARFVSKKISKMNAPAQKQFKVYSDQELAQFDNLIKLGAGRKIKYQTPAGEVVMELKEVATRFVYEFKSRQYDAASLIAKMASQNIEWVAVNPLTPEDRIYI